VVFNTFGDRLGFVRDSRLRAIAVTSAAGRDPITRSPSAPEHDRAYPERLKATIY
jgi:hypothetical protein